MTDILTPDERATLAAARKVLVVPTIGINGEFLQKLLNLIDRLCAPPADAGGKVEHIETVTLTEAEMDAYNQRTPAPPEDAEVAELIDAAMDELHHDREPGDDVDIYERRVLTKNFSAIISKRKLRERAVPVDKDAFIRAICPIVKPWMDHDLAKHSCNCEIMNTPYGAGTTVCRSVMTEIYDAALALIQGRA